MSVDLSYNETATIVKVQADGYGNKKVPVQQIAVPAIFLQGTGFDRSSFQENVTADAILYVDPTNAFVVANHMRLEGMYVVMQLFGSDADQSWYKIVTVTVNRDHLLENQINNVECVLKKTRPIEGVS